MIRPIEPGLRILLVEDQPIIRHLLGQLLGALGHSVVLASRFDQAYCFVQNSSFDLLISDINLADGCGLDLIRQIREMSDLPAIAMSGDHDLEGASLACGYSGFLAKPVTFQHLQDEIARLTCGSASIREQSCTSC
ncbi:response regulator [Tundrisphaera lichenicola]|uniref:response regulator n=1 Tax=Tundrisphaera lichenicola TaxID=2029860 RepID=UPI003EBD9C90